MPTALTAQVLSGWSANLTLSGLWKGCPLSGNMFETLTRLSKQLAYTDYQSHSVISTNPSWASWDILAIASVFTWIPGSRSAFPHL